jgi:threonine dehydrogenase-like Zn-dependent dehydrogenase
VKALAVYPNEKRYAVIAVHPEPKVESPTQAKVKILDVGICGTDKEILNFDYGTPPPGSDYLVIGHESLGEVVECGTEVRNIKPGDLVVTMVRRPCPHPNCMACQAGRPDFCYTGDFTERGIKGQHGFMTEFIVDEAVYMNPVSRELRDVAVLVEPLTIAEKGVTQLWEVQQRLPWVCPLEPGKKGAYCHKALVLGAGPVGLLGAMKMVLEGFETFVYSRSHGGEERAEIVDAIGGKFIHAERTSVQDAAKQIGGIDVVYEAVGASRLAFDVLEHLDTNGVFIMTGVPGRKDPVQVDTDLIMRNYVLKNQLMYGTVNASKESFEYAIRDLGQFVKRWPKAVRQLISNRFPIDRASEPLSGKAGGIKNVIAIAQ